MAILDNENPSMETRSGLPLLPDAHGVIVGDTVYLDGSSYHAETYRWAMTRTPRGSHVLMRDDGTATPSFVADEEGDYVLLVETDGRIRGSVGVRASAAPADPGPVVGEGAHTEAVTAAREAQDGRPDPQRSGEPGTRPAGTGSPASAPPSIQVTVTSVPAVPAGAGTAVHGGSPSRDSMGRLPGESGYSGSPDHLQSGSLRPGEPGYVGPDKPGTAPMPHSVTPGPVPPAKP